jgi:hypothetical protein
MEVQLGRHVLVNLSQEIQILLVPMALSALRNYRPPGCVQRREQCGRRVSPVVVRYRIDVAQPDGQHRLGAIERWNLAVLIHTQHDCIFRGI